MSEQVRIDNFGNEITTIDGVDYDEFGREITWGQEIVGDNMLQFIGSPTHEDYEDLIIKQIAKNEGVTYKNAKIAFDTLNERYGGFHFRPDPGGWDRASYNAAEREWGFPVKHGDKKTREISPWAENYDKNDPYYDTWYGYPEDYDFQADEFKPRHERVHSHDTWHPDTINFSVEPKAYGGTSGEEAYDEWIAEVGGHGKQYGRDIKVDEYGRRWKSGALRDSIDQEWQRQWDLYGDTKWIKPTGDKDWKRIGEQRRHWDKTKYGRRFHSNENWPNKYGPLSAYTVYRQHPHVVKYDVSENIEDKPTNFENIDTTHFPIGPYHIMAANPGLWNPDAWGKPTIEAQAHGIDAPPGFKSNEDLFYEELEQELFKLGLTKLKPQ